MSVLHTNMRRRRQRRAMMRSTALATLAGAGAIALAMGAAPPAAAANYTVANEPALSTAITDANANPDAESTITFGSPFFGVSATPYAVSKTLTIDTSTGFLAGNPAPSSSGPSGVDGESASFSGGALTVRGTFTGGTGGDAIGYYNAHAGAGGAGITRTDGSLTIDGATLSGGTGGSFQTAVDFVFTAGAGGAGAVMTNGAIINSGTVLGGTGGTAFGGSVGGGNNMVGGAGGAGVVLTNGSLDNSGHITGGNGTDLGAGGVGVIGVGATIINSGIITAGFASDGTTRANAIEFSGGVNSLEIQDGSIITGDVVAFSAADTLKLGGATDSNFDVSQIGAAAQYQGFGIYEKTGASTWTLTGTTTAITPWTLTQGILQISSDSNLGDPSAGLTFTGGTLETTADISSARTIIFTGDGTFLTDPGTTLTLTGGMSGAGGLIKTGTGTVTLTGTSNYTGDTVVYAGVLQVAGGGRVSNAEGVIDGDSSGSGEVLITGQDSSWENAGRLSIDDAGKLIIEDGATVTNADGLIGGSARGDVVVTGSSTTWASAGQLTVGSYGIGTLLIENGATVTSNQGYIGSGSTSDGSVVVTGPESSWTTTAFDINIGNYGTGALTIENGARVHAEDGVELGLSDLSSNGTLTLLGTVGARGVLETSQIQGGLGTAKVTIDGGIVRATQDNADFVSGFGTQAITIAANGATIDTNGHDISIAAQFGGAGDLSKVGTGTLTLSGANTYSGGTTISGGTLTGPATNFGTGAILDNAALVIDQPADASFANAISGTGSFTKQGAATLVLTADNTYSGGTTISSGTLSGSATSFGTGAILDNAVLVIDQAADAAFANAINGTGSFTKRGARALNYTGTGDLSGPTTVAAGRLSVNGSLANSAVAVQSGGTLGGNGTVGATMIQIGGTIAPGNSIGTLHVNGAYSQAAGSVYQVQVDPNSNASDLIDVSGQATLASGAGLNVAKDGPGGYQAGTKYTVLHTVGGLDGTYSLSGDTQALSPYLALEDIYDANNAYLEVVQTGDPATAAETPNQTETATGMPDNGGVGTAVLNTPDPETTRAAFDQLSGEALASAKSALVSGSVLLRDSTFDRLRDVFCAQTSDDTSHPESRNNCRARSDQPSVWVQGFGNWGNVSGNGNAAGLTDSTGGFLVGVDVPVYDWRVGYFGGFSRTDFNVKARSSSGVSDNYHLGLYGGTQWGDLGLRLGASYSWNGLATDRSVAIDDFSNDLHATYNAGTTQIFGELGQRFALDQFILEPFANLAYVNLRTDGFSETGGDAALTAKADTMKDIFTTLGVRPSADISWGSFNATVRGMVGWRHAFGDVTPSSVVAFAGSNAFTIDGVPIARDAGVVEAGLDFTVRDDITAGLTYGGQFSSRETDNSIRGTLAITF